MTRARRMWWLLLVLAAVLILVGVVVLGFRSEPSAVGRMRGALYVIGVGSILLGVASGVGGVWMLASRRT